MNGISIAPVRVSASAVWVQPTSRDQWRAAYLLLATISFILTVTLQVETASGNEPAIPRGGDHLTGIADPDLRLYWPQQKLCGAVAVHAALLDHGIRSDFKSIVRALPPGDQGTSMLDCSNQLRESGLGTLCVQFSPHSLQSLLRAHPDLGAIILVDGNHWIYARTGKSNRIRCFDYPSWYIADDVRLFERSSGPAIIVGDKSGISQLWIWQIVWYASLGIAVLSAGAFMWLRHRNSISKESK